MSLSLSFDLGDGQPVHLASAILVYKGGKHAFGTDCEVVRLPDGGACLGPGRPLDKAQMARLLEGLAGRPESGGYLDARILSFSADRIIWWVPGERRPIWFAGEAARTAGHISGREVPHPGLVMAASENALEVYVHAGLSRPTPDTPLYHAPYPNVWIRGTVCRGSAIWPDRWGPGSLSEWERAWFDSAFTHANSHGAERQTSYSGGVVGLWKDLASGALTQFPADTLLPANKTLGDLIDGGKE